MRLGYTVDQPKTVRVRVMESFQLQMGFSFPFLRANDLRSSLLIMITRSFLLSCMWVVHTLG